VNLLGELTIKITSDEDINAIYTGLVLSGYEYSHIEKSPEIIKVIDHIKEQSFSSDVKRYFEHARQQTCEVYPFWPRASLLESAVFFMGSEGFMFDKYCEYVNSCPNLTQEERNKDFFDWIITFPKYMGEIKENRIFQEINSQIQRIVNELSTVSAAGKERIIDILKALAADCDIIDFTLDVLVCPLKCVYSADYFIEDSKMSIILGDFLPHSIVHEYMHIIVRPKIDKYRAEILSLFGKKRFNIDNSYYLENDERGFINL
jgi:hypothetical protein